MSYIQIVGGTGGAGGGVAVSLSGNTSGALALVSTGTAIFAGGNNITLSQNGQSITISGAAQTGTPGTFSMWEPAQMNVISTQTRALGQSSLYLYPLYVPVNLSVSQMLNLMSITVSTSSNSSWAAAISQSAGIYTITGSTLNLLTASSGATNVAFTNTSNNSTASLQGLRGFTVPMAFNATPGNYWIGFLSATASTNTNWVTMSNCLASQANSIYSGQIGEVAAASRGLVKGLGFYSAQTAALPATIGLAELTGSQLLTMGQLYMNFQGI